MIGEPVGAVFLSYASQDAVAARRICEALRAGGIEVWFDQSELRGGDAWDAEIRRQIKTCTLFMPLISRNTRAREEGYFRLEWKLAVDRSHLMSAAKSFFVPIAIDEADNEGHVPEKFREVQWTQLPAGETPQAFVTRIKQLLTHGEASAAARSPSSAAAAPGVAVSTGQRRSRAVPLLFGLLALIGAGYFAAHRWVHGTGGVIGALSAVFNESAQIAIPELSIAVLPFVNMSSDKEQEYFSDGLTEEMIDLLGQVPQLRVPARTSSFFFKGKNETVGNIARQLKVAHLLEGSVRKAGARLRITAQLIRADNGYQLWSQTYDRDDSDIFNVQDDIARAVVGAMKVKLGAAAVRVTGARGTTNTEAYDKYLLGKALYRRESIEGYHHAVDAYRQAIALDPNYAAAYAQMALAHAWIGDFTGDSRETDNAEREVEKAIALAPEDATGYTVRSFIRSSWLWDWSGAQADIEKALLIDPNSQVEHQHARLLDSLGRPREALAAQKRSTELDPLSNQAWENLGVYHMELGDYAQADASFARAIELEPTSVFVFVHVGTLRLLQGRVPEALQTFRKVTQDAFRLEGIAMAEYSLGHTKPSQQALAELIAKYADEAACQIAEAFAWLGEKDQAFEWLERSYKQHDGGLSFVKNELLLKSLHSDPRFNALLRKLKLPEQKPE